MASQALQAVGGIGGNLLGALFQGQQNDWLKNSLIQLLNNSQQANQFGIDRSLPAYGSLLDSGQNLINLGTQFSFGAPGSGQGGQFTNLSDDLNSIFSGLNPGQFQGNGLSGNSQSSLGDLFNVAGGMQGNQDYLQQLLQGGGVTGQSSDLASQLQNLFSGQAGQMQSMYNTGTSLVNNQGQNGFTQNLQNNANNIISGQGQSALLQDAANSAKMLMGNGGMSTQLNSLFGSGNSILGSGGNTPQNAAGISAALQGFQGGGATPFLQSMQNNGLQIASQSPLMSPAQAAAIARDQAAGNFRNSVKSLRTQALARGGGPGATVANGTTNEALADMSDQGAQGISQAVQNALLSQQGLGLQEQGLGASMGLGAAGTQAGQLGTYGGTLAGLGGVSNQRLGIGANTATSAADTGMQAFLASLGLLPTVQNSATNLMGTAGNLGLGGGQLALGNLSEGGNLLNGYNQASLGGMNALNSLIGNQNQYALGAGSLFNQGSNTQGNILGNVLQGNISGDQLGLSQANSYQSALQNILGQRGNVAQQGLGLINSGMSPLSGLYSTSLGYAGNGLDLQKGLFSGYNPQSTLGNFFNGNASGNPISTILKGIGLG